LIAAAALGSVLISLLIIDISISECDQSKMPKGEYDCLPKVFTIDEESSLE
jgi:hypothetical protein